MYAAEVVARRIELAQEELGWALEYHSPSELDVFNTDLARKYEGIYEAARIKRSGSQNPTQTYRVHLHNELAHLLTLDEQRFIQNERYLSMCDAAYWLTRYYWIKNEKNIIQRFAFRKPQRIFFDAISELERIGGSVEVITGKARQLGVSTEVTGLLLQRATMIYGVNAVIASASRKQIGLMAKMVFLGYDMLPWWLPPLDSRRVESDQGMLTWGEMQSGIDFQHGAQTSGIARGYTPTLYHLSEVSDYPNAEELIEASLFKAVHPSRNVFGVLESTFAGDTGWFYDSYWHAKREWKNHRSRLYPQFLPWYLGVDIYPMEADRLSHPVPQDWRPMDETRQMMARAKMFIDSAPILSKVMGSDWQMGADQAWYWEWNYFEARQKGQEKLWFQEMPTDDIEAAQGSYDNVFGRDLVAEVFTRREHTYKVYGLVGQSIEDRFEPLEEEVDYGKERIPATYRSARGETFRWEMVPLQWTDKWEKVRDLSDADAFNNKLLIFHPPEPEYDYSIGVDTSNGIGSDATCVAVCRRGKTPQEPDVQVAEFRSNYVSHVEAYAFVMPIATYYSKYMSSTTRFKEPYVSVEQVAAVGDTCQMQMRKLGYGRFHHMVRYDSKDVRKNKSKKMGWYTFSWSRPMLTDGFVISVQNGWYVVNSPVTIWEMDHWEVHLTAMGKSRFEHSSEATDDGIFANAMATFCPNDLNSLAKRTKKRLDGSDELGLPPIDIGEWDGWNMSTRTGGENEH